MSPKIRKFGITLTLLVAAACWGWGYLAARQGYWVTVAIAFSVSAIWLLSIRIMVASTDVSPRTESTSEGTLIRPDIRIDRSVQAIAGIGAVVMWTGMVASFPYGALYIPLFSELPESFLVLPVVCLAGALGFTWSWWRYTRRGISSLMLTLEGFRFPSLRNGHGRWDDVTEIRDVLPGGEGRFWDPMVLMMKDGTYLALESPGIYTPGGTALVELVRYYWQHPEQRHNLVNGQAIEHLQRLQDANLDTD